MATWIVGGEKKGGKWMLMLLQSPLNWLDLKRLDIRRPVQTSLFSGALA